MASELPGRPRLLKGALVAYDTGSSGPVPSIFTFQYNPERINRTLSRLDAMLSQFRFGTVRAWLEAAG